MNLNFTQPLLNALGFFMIMVIEMPYMKSSSIIKANVQIVSIRICLTQNDNKTMATYVHSCYTQH